MNHQGVFTTPPHALDLGIASEKWFFPNTIKKSKIDHLRLGGKTIVLTLPYISVRR